MRVIAGTAKGRKLVTPKGIKTRPTADRVKESIFNIIGGRMPGATVLDLYAGSGALAIEALSRGAATVTLVESDIPAIDSIERNFETTGFTDKAKVEGITVRQALTRLERTGQKFDLILLDPPYRIEPAELQEVLLQAQRCLAEAGLVVVEHRADLVLSDQSGELSKVDMRVYGETAVAFYGKQEN